MKKVQIGSQEVQVGEVDELCRVLADEVESLLVARAEQGKCAVLGKYNMDLHRTCCLCQ